MKAYKAFDENLRCRSIKYEVGKSYHENVAVLCKKGFHACENPLDVFNHYDLVGSRFAEVELQATEERSNEDTNRVGTDIYIKRELSIKSFIRESHRYLRKNAETSTSENMANMASSGYNSKLVASGVCAYLASSGDNSQLSASGDASYLAASGCGSVLIASGDRPKLASAGAMTYLAASGNMAQLAVAGNRSQLAASGNGSQLASSGSAAKLSASGNNSRLVASGNDSELSASGAHAVVMCAGKDCMAKASKGSWIVLTEWKKIQGKDVPVNVVAKQVDGVEIKDNVFYRVKDGKFVQVAKGEEYGF